MSGFRWLSAIASSLEVPLLRAPCRSLRVPPARCCGARLRRPPRSLTALARATGVEQTWGGGRVVGAVDR